ncbi:MAG: hypothetical protein H8E59_11820 [Actinobacteria bacterium]|nr:hypothetical protein [Actinomycetota bacterium]
MSFLRLLGSEIERFLARRLARGLVLTVLAIGALVGVLVFINSHPDTWNSGFRATELLSGSGGDLADWSEQRPTRSGFGEDGFGDWGNTPYPGLQGIVGAIGMTVALLFGGIVGASFLGAEYRYGTIEQVLLWEPRRHRLLAAKYIVVFLGSALITMFAIACFSAALWPAAVWRGSTSGVDGRFWLDLASVIGRTGVVAGLFGIIAATVALVTKHTTAAILGMLGYNIVAGIAIAIWLQRFYRWDPLQNAIAFITEGDAGKLVKLNGWHETVYSHTYLAAGALLAAYAAGFAAVGFVVFRRRDVS